ncbi:MAG: helix-turn-helix domain-containing protein, partial [Ghiorsea sp.]|nr:helix-turn-helix domain-containing protein [Ghiorsea sp.]
KLADYIYCYWELKTIKPLHENYTYNVVTDGCMDIFWEVGIYQQSFVTGFTNQYTEFLLSRTFQYLGVRFLPSAFPLLFQINASELTNKFEALDAVAPKLAAMLIQRMEGINNLQMLKPQLDVLLLNHLKDVNLHCDPRLYHAMDLILKSQGVLSIEKDLNVGISARQLRRIFQFYIGDSPKVFSNVVRFQSLLQGKPSSQSLHDNTLYYDLGYYDQAHFIKAFKHLYGETPNKALK